MSTINPVYARLVVRHLQEVGVAAADVLARAGCSSEELYCGDDLDLDKFRRLLEAAESVVQDVPLGFLIGKHQNTLALGPIGAAMGAAPTLRDGFQVLESYTRLHASYIRIELVSNLNGMSIKLHFQHLEGSVLRHHSEASLMLFQHHVETISGKRFEDGLNRLSYPAPDYADEYARFLHNSVHFDQAVVALELPQHWLDQRSPYYHRELWEQSQRQLALRLRELGSSQSGAYHVYVQALLRSHEPPLPGLGEIARQLHLSERSLNRRLQDEGSSFRKIRQGILDDWACRHLTETNVSIEAIAGALGYQDAANFRRAFRKRMGMAPGAYRNQSSAENNVTRYRPPVATI